MTTYATVRAAIAAQLIDDLPTWTIYDHPTARLDERSIMIAPLTSSTVNESLWRRQLVVAVVVRFSDPQASVDELDSVAVPLRDSLLSLPFVSYSGEISEPREIEIAGTSYLATFVEITTETTS